MRVYYNEFDAKKAAALKALMDDGFISIGDIDTRPIQNVQPDDLKHYDRCHFFAGIGLWDYALNLARWPENHRVWTGSCPCQPFSTAGRQKGKNDDRHLWPFWFSLIQECQPPVIFGEQVANAISKGWLDDVYQGLEAENYTVGSAVLPACSVGAPHKRDRLWFVAHTAHSDDRRNAGEFQKPDEFKTQERQERRSAQSGGASVVGDTEHDGSYATPFTGGHEEINDGCTEKQNGSVQSERTGSARSLSGKALANTTRPRTRVNQSKFWQRVSGNSSYVADTESQQGSSGNAEFSGTEQEQHRGRSRCGSMGQPKFAGLERHAWDEERNDQQRWDEAQSHGSAWSSGIWINCPDGKQRLIEPSIHLLADGHPERVGLLHSAGDAIVPQLAAEFIECSLAVIPGHSMQNSQSTKL